MIYHNSYWLILYQIDFGKLLSDWYFIRLIIGKFLSIDISSDQKCWKIIEKVVFLIILLGLRHTLGVGFLKFQHLKHFKASNSEISFQFISDHNLSYWSLANSYQIDFLQILNDWYCFRSKMLEYRQNGWLNDNTVGP